MPRTLEGWLAEQPQDGVDQALAKYIDLGSPMADYGVTDVYFGLWLWLCDRYMTRKIGLGIFDIADWLWADAYADGFSPSAACNEALASDDTYQMFMGGE